MAIGPAYTKYLQPVIHILKQASEATVDKVGVFKIISSSATRCHRSFLKKPAEAYAICLFR